MQVSALWMLQKSHLQGASLKVTTHAYIITSRELELHRMCADLEDKDSNSCLDFKGTGIHTY